MSILGLDKNGELVQLGEAGVSSKAPYVEDGNVAFAEYDAEAAKKLAEIKLAKMREARARERVKRERQLRYAQQLGAEQEKNVAMKYKARAAQKLRNQQKANVYLESATQPNTGFDYTHLTGNPFAGFGAGGEFVDNPNLHHQGKKDKIARVEHFNRNTMVGYEDYDGTIGSLFSNIIGGVTSVAKKVAAPVKKITRVVKSTTKVALAPATITAKVVVGTVTGGTSGGKEAFKEGTTETFRDVRDVRGTTAELAAPVTKPVVQATGVVWEAAPTRLVRGVVFNKYTDPGYHIKEAHKTLDKIPFAGAAYDTIDKYTGNTLTKIEVAAAVPGKLGRGEPVSKAELLTAAVVCLQAGAIAGAAFTGGATIAIVGMMASSMKQGPLGQSETGRAILTIAEVGAYAYGGYAAGAGSAAGAGAGAAGTVGATAAQQTATQAVTQAVMTKAQATLAEKAAQKIAKETGTGILGQIAVSSALGPGSFEEAASSQLKTQAAQEVGARTGVAGQLIAQSVVAASVRTDQTLSTAPVAATFQQTLTQEIEKRVRDEALKVAESESKKALGDTGSAIFMAAVKGEDVGQVVKSELDAKAKQMLIQELNARTSGLEISNAQKMALIAGIQGSTPEGREALFNKAVDADLAIIPEQVKRNQNLTQLDFATGKQQAILSDNANTALVSGVSARPDTSLTLEQRKKNAELVQQAEAEKLAATQEKFFNYSIAVNLAVGRLKELADQATALKQEGKLKEAAAIEEEMIKINKEVAANEDAAMFQAQLLEIQKAQAGVRMAAAEEGRYNLGALNIQHPMAKYGLA